MKKKNSVAIAALTLVASSTYAQSSVTLYGIVDEGLLFNSNAAGKHLYSLASGVLQGSRWGLRGSEDLGGGYKAIFVIENGFDVNNGRLGQGGLAFGRQAFVGVGSPFGTITLGRQYDSVVDYVGAFGAGEQWGGYNVAHPGDLDNFNNSSRVNNAIKFTSLKYAGVTFGGLYSLGGVAGDYSRNQIWSLGIGYLNGPLSLGAGYLNVRNPNVSFFGNNTTGTPSPTASNAPAGTPIYNGFASARTYSVAAAGGAYAFGPATVGLTYSNISFRDLGDLSTGPNPRNYSGNATFNNMEANFKYQFTPALLVGFAYDYTNGGSVSGKGSATYHQFAAGTDYFLSKRTDLYTTVTFQKASGTDSTGRSAVASIASMTPSASSKQVAFRVAMRHKF